MGYSLPDRVVRPCRSTVSFDRVVRPCHSTVSFDRRSDPFRLQPMGRFKSRQGVDPEPIPPELLHTVNRPVGRAQVGPPLGLGASLHIAPEPLHFFLAADHPRAIMCGRIIRHITSNPVAIAARQPTVNPNAKSVQLIFDLPGVCAERTQQEARRRLCPSRP